MTTYSTRSTSDQKVNAAEYFCRVSWGGVWILRCQPPEEKQIHLQLSYASNKLLAGTQVKTGRVGSGEMKRNLSWVQNPVLHSVITCNYRLEQEADSQIELWPIFTCLHRFCVGYKQKNINAGLSVSFGLSFTSALPSLPFSVTHSVDTPALPLVSVTSTSNGS